MKTCPHCGKQANDNSIFCTECGGRLDNQPAPPSDEPYDHTKQYTPEEPQYVPECNTSEYLDQAPKKKGLRWWGVLLIVFGAIAAAFIILCIVVLIVSGVAGTPTSSNGADTISQIVSSQVEPNSETESAVNSELQENTSSVSESASSEAPSELTETEIDQLYTDPGAFKGRRVTLTGRVFQNPEKDRNVMYFQIFTDIENSDRNTVIAYQSDEALVAVDDYVRVTGVVQGEDRGYNAFGGIISAPRVLADSIEIVSYAEAAAPSLKTVELSGVTQDQYGYSITVHKVEFAEKETRVYVSVQNNGSSSFSVYSFNTKIVQDGKQYEEKMNFYADYPEIQTDLQPGVTTQGVIAFPAMNQSDFQIIFEGYSDNWDESIEDYTFNITVQ